jgi:hypothetical protein
MYEGRIDKTKMNEMEMERVDYSGVSVERKRHHQLLTHWQATM